MLIVSRLNTIVRNARDIILITEDMPEVQNAPSLSSNGFQYQQAYNTLPIDVINKGIATLNQLFSIDTPIKTGLLNNYPNPFNPETWIPYQLSKAADVTVTIYASDGNVVWTLSLGHQAAGTYKNRSQAAYWDGKNEVGESVASGVYFYTLIADSFSATRKMLILNI